jgi:hypothetical protein
MLVPSAYCTRPTVEQTRTRRPLSGALADGLTTCALHTLLARTRPCVTHHVEGLELNWDYAERIPLWAAATVRVRMPLSDRAARIAAAVHYRSEGASKIDITLHNSADAAAPLDTQTLSCPVVYELIGTGYIQYTIGVTYTPPSSVLVVPAGSAGQSAVVRLTPGAFPPRVQIIAVSLYELPSDQEAP